MYEISIIDPGAARERWFPLLNLADEAAPLRRYLHDGTLYGVVDAALGRVAGTAPCAGWRVVRADRLHAGRMKNDE